MKRLGIVMVAVCLHVVSLGAQSLDLSDPAISAVAPRDQEVTLTYENRPILLLRARVMNRLPADRAANASKLIRELVSEGTTGPVRTRPEFGARIISVGQQDIIAVTPADLYVLNGETLDATAELAATRLRAALEEARELRTVRSLIRGALAVFLATALVIALGWLLRRAGRAARLRFINAAESRTTATWRLVQVANLPRIAAFLVRVSQFGVASVLLYFWLSFVLRQFPYTRPWGESLRSLMLGEVSAAGGAFSAALPGLITVAIIFVIVKVITRAVKLVFDAAEAGRMSLPGVYPDTAGAARRLTVATLWLLALAMAYPHIPGSESSAFKGLSVFVGVVISIGSSGVMQHLMSGLMLTFSRAVHVGDFARIGDVTGTVLQIGALATKVRTPYGEEITIPNAVVVSQTTTNYSKAPDTVVPFLTTSVTIGYDTPWRQVEGLLLMAAHETAGLHSDPKPFVWREGLQDFYVKYTLLVAPIDPNERPVLLDRLHVRILDAFNQYGVQIMSPHYMVDPHDQKVVPPTRWHQAPAPVGSAAGGAVAETPRRS
jgi:small-conductance mechanosensitive channel